MFSARCCGTRLSSGSGKGKNFFRQVSRSDDGGGGGGEGGVGSPPARRGVCSQHVTLFIGESHVSREIIGLCERLDKWSTAYGASRTTEARFRFHHPLPLIYPHQTLGDSILFHGPRRFPECRRCNTQTPLRRCFSPRETGSLLRSGASLFTFPIKATRESISRAELSHCNHEYVNCILQAIYRYRRPVFPKKDVPSFPRDTFPPLAPFTDTIARQTCFFFSHA